jgi:Protein of unknown function DUF262
VLYFRRSPLTEVIREGRCGVRDLLQSYDQMAIPHFQRGLVWDPGSVALLLESLYFGTPCGSILLWRPKHPREHGVALGKRPEYLIIDGQQRIRSLHDVLASIVNATVFDVRVLGPKQDLKSVVSAYNRINSAGKRVESEERAFASLVSVTAHTEATLREFFSTSRPRRQGSVSQADASHIERDDLVRREKENRFGVKLFMRVFVIAFAYHSDRSIGSSSFSFNSIDSRRLDAGSKHLKYILDSAVRLLSSVAEILRTKLHCDDFRMLPDTSSLWPVFQCMVRFPGLASTCPDWIAATTLRLMLADLTIGQLLNLAAQVNDAPDAAEAMAMFDGRPLRANSVATTIRRGVKRAQSLTDKYALVLYWLIRRHGARDFSYDANLDEAKAKELREKGAIHRSASTASGYAARAPGR